MEPRVSVAIITYNQEEFVSETLNSVLHQDYRDYEIVVSDDGSTDGTVRILKEYEEAYPDKVRVVLSDSNTGITENCNRALRACTGKYIAWLGGDDLFYPGKLSSQVRALEHHSDCSLSYHSVRVFESQTGNTIEISNEHDPYIQTLPEILWQGVSLPSSSVVVRRDCCPANGFDSEVPVASDWLFYLETLLRGKAVKIRGVFGAYRRHGRNVTNHSILNDMEITFSRIQTLRPDLRRYVARALSITYYREGRRLLSSRQLRQARRLFVRSLLADVTYPQSLLWLVISLVDRRLLRLLKKSGKWIVSR